VILKGLPKSESKFRLLTNVEVRRLKDQMGLDTPVVFAVNYAC